MADDRSPDHKGQGSTNPEADLEARRRALGEKLAAVRREEAAKAGGAPAQDGAMGSLGRGFRYSADFTAGVLAGVLIGWGTDHFFGTSPWGLMIFIVLGFAAGIFNLVRLVERERRERDR